MKRVFRSYEVPHLWATNTDPARTARNSQGNISFSGSVLTSYGHYPIGNKSGKIVKGREVVLIQENKYSTTTARQIHRAVYALDTSKYYALRVPHLGAAFGQCRPEHDQNIAWMIKQGADNKGKAERARSNISYYLRELDQITADHVTYCKAFKIKRVKFPSFTAKTRQALKDKALAYSALEDQRRLKREEHKKQARLESFEAWKTNTPGYYGTFPMFPVALRISADGLEIETSLGARVPLSDAVRAIGAFKAGTFGAGDQIGEYTAVSVNADGVKIGCHVISREEIDRLAAVLSK